MKTINENYTYNNEGYEQPIYVDFLLSDSNCYMYYLTNTQGAESADEAKRMAKLFSKAPQLLELVKAFLKTGYYSSNVGNNANELMQELEVEEFMPV